MEDTRRFVYSLMNEVDVTPQLREFACPPYANQLPLDSVLCLSTVVFNGKTARTNVYYGPEITYCSNAAKPAILDETTQFNIGSMGKIIMMVMVMRLVQRGHLKLADTVDDLIQHHGKEYFDPAFLAIRDSISNITVEQLLSHRSGLKDIRFRNDEKGESLSEFIHFFKPPGDFFYANANYILLAYLLEAVEKKPLYELLKTWVIEPLGLKNTAHIHHADADSPLVHGQVLREGLFLPDDTYLFGAVSFTSCPTDIAKILFHVFNDPEFFSAELVKNIETSMRSEMFVVEREKSQGGNFSWPVEVGITVEKFYIQGTKAIMPRPAIGDYRVVYGMGCWTNGSSGFVLCDPKKPMAYAVSISKLHVPREAPRLTGSLSALLWPRASSNKVNEEKQEE